nr:cupin domain-containing protein [uncultured Megasphaera sp.]
MQGTYNRWHSHKRGQILIATDGIGYTQTLGGAVQVMHPGDVVYCPPGVIHWHGAAPGSHFAHIAISPEDNHDVTWYFFPKLEYEKLGFHYLPYVFLKLNYRHFTFHRNLGKIRV